MARRGTTEDPTAAARETRTTRYMTHEDTTDVNTTADTDTPDPEGYERVPIDDWAGIESHMRRIAGRGSIETSDAEIAVQSGSARFAVTRDGGIDAGMPLHAFEKGDIEALYFDHGRDRIRVYGSGGLAYEFRKP